MPPDSHAATTSHESRITNPASAGNYRAPAWLPGGHAQTLYAALMMPRARVAYRRERWETPDGDFVDVDWAEDQSAASWQPSAASHPLIVLFHGLEGSSRSHYALALMAEALRRGWRGCVVHFRGCSGEPNRLPRAYHSGDAAEIGWIARRLREKTRGALYAVGVSLGGNALLKWLTEIGAEGTAIVDKAATVSAPIDVMAAGNALGTSGNRLYAWHFLRTLKPKALAKLERHAGLYDAALVRAARTLRAFDDVVTAPLHGFRDTDDYWTRASCKPGLMAVRVPALVINARNDPFLPAAALPGPDDVSSAITLEQPEHGGHVGFVSGPFPGHLRWMPERVCGFLASP